MNVTSAESATARPIGKTCVHAPILFLILTACSREPSPEDRIREVIVAAEQGAEARDLSDVMAVVSDRYSDLRGNDKAGVRDLMRGYFLINQSIHLLMRVEDIVFASERVATARITVGMLGRQDVGATDWRLAADVYEFDVRLFNEDGEWRLQSADWHAAVR